MFTVIFVVTGVIVYIIQIVLVVFFACLDQRHSLGEGEQRKRLRKEWVRDTVILLIPGFLFLFLLGGISFLFLRGIVKLPESELNRPSNQKDWPTDDLPFEIY